MRCTLMHKRIEVAKLELDDETGIIHKIEAVMSTEHIPVGVPVKNGIVDRSELNKWWTDRSIPASRSGVREALETLNLPDTKILLVRCFGLSLSDQYWIRPEGKGLTWEKINFFDNSFSDDMGDVLFGKPNKAKDFDFSSPDNTSDGYLKKRWKIINGKRCLIKGGSNLERQQPFNEVIASKIMDRLGIAHVPYDIVWGDGEPYSVCEDFVTADTELVSAWRIMQTRKKDNSTSVYRHFVDCCKDIVAPDVVPALDRMIVLDYIIANEDRHLNNFGLLRNAETLEWLGFAPVYDSGSSLGYNSLISQIQTEKNIACKPFKRRHDEQIKLVTSYDWIDFSKLYDAGDMVREAFSDPRAKELISENRKEAIAQMVERHIESLQTIAERHAPQEESTEDDVEENIAEDYIPKM